MKVYILTAEEYDPSFSDEYDGTWSKSIVGVYSYSPATPTDGYAWLRYSIESYDVQEEGCP